MFLFTYTWLFFFYIWFKDQIDLSIFPLFFLEFYSQLLIQVNVERNVLILLILHIIPLNVKNFQDVINVNNCDYCLDFQQNIADIVHQNVDLNPKKLTWVYMLQGPSLERVHFLIKFWHHHYLKQYFYLQIDLVFE